MIGTLGKHYTNWRDHPRRMEISYILQRIRAIASGIVRSEALSRQLDPPLDPGYVALLNNEAFRSSVNHAKDFSELDEGRLANLWSMVGLVGPGIFLEVGTFRGGTALHICNAIDFYQKNARFYCFDPFELGGFEKLDDIDEGLQAADFTGVKRIEVEHLLASKPYAHVVQGFFPASAEMLGLREIAYCHLDVDTYEATYKCLDYLAPRLASKSLIVLDDIGHVGIYGAERAIKDFLESRPEFLFIPLFPCQAILLPKHLW